MTLRCRYTDKPIDPAEGIYDEGEWISWEYIQTFQDDLLLDSPSVDEDYFLEVLVELSKAYKRKKARYLSVWGEMGELYAEAQYGLKRNKPYAQGSDGHIGNDLIEVKTISPEKTKKEVSVKRSGNFNVLVVVLINEDFSFDSRWVPRKDLILDNEELAKYQWNASSS